MLVLGIMVYEFTFPHYAIAAEPGKSVLLPTLVIRSAEVVDTDSTVVKNNETVLLIEPVKEPRVLKTYKLTITAYTSEKAQTDSTPCITANGYDLCEANEENVIAANFLPMGTKVRIPEHFGDRVFTVQDRMNARYKYRADVWMKELADARKWGAKYTVIEVIE